MRFSRLSTATIATTLLSMTTAGAASAQNNVQIPEQFHGTWNTSAFICELPVNERFDDGEMHIAGNAISHYEGGEEILAVRPVGENTIEYDALYTEAGDDTSESRMGQRLTLSPSGRALRLLGEHNSYYVRCD